MVRSPSPTPADSCTPSRTESPRVSTSNVGATSVGATSDLACARARFCFSVSAQHSRHDTKEDNTVPDQT
eukprot:2198221-Rhodomonas_salina.5